MDAKYFKNENNEVFSFDANGSQDEFISKDLIAITEAEADELRLPPILPPITQYSPNDFLDLFTNEEQLAVAEAAMSNVAIKLWYDRMLAADYVDLKDPRTPAGLSALVAENLIPQSRADSIMQAVTN